jgi:RIO-like serine/threonine protein kinase
MYLTSNKTALDFGIIHGHLSEVQVFVRDSASLIEPASTHLPAIRQIARRDQVCYAEP